MGVLSEVESQLAGKRANTMMVPVIPVATATVGRVSPHDDDIWRLSASFYLVNCKIKLNT